MKRYPSEQVRRDLARKMVFVGGPRPVGKTTFAKPLRSFKLRFPDCDAWQLSATGKKDFVTPDGIRAAPALAMLGDLV